MHEHIIPKSLCSTFTTFTLWVTHFHHTLSLFLPTTDCNSENWAQGNCNTHHCVCSVLILFNLSKNNSCKTSKRSAHEILPSHIHGINLTVQHCRISAMQLPQSTLFLLSHLNLLIPAGFKHRKLLSAEKGKTLNDSQVVKWHIIIRQMAWSWL